MKNMIIFILLICPLIGESQFHSEYFTREPGLDSSGFTVSLNAAGFFHNNEYFSTDEKGYTLPGNYFQPLIKYRLNSELSVSGGLHFLKYHGQDGFNQLDPFFNIKYDFAEKGNILIGSYNGGDYHQLPEELMAREIHFSDLVMNGVLINYSSGRWETRTWIDWERFIERGDPFREEFSFSFTGKYSLIKNENQEFLIPLYFMANHKGGQINNRTRPVETISDFSSGLIYKKPINNSIFDNLDINGLVFLEGDTENQESGYAFLGQGNITGEILSLSLGYFYGSNWESIKGNPLLFCGDDNSIDTKSMILLKAGLGKSISKTSTFSIRFEGYYDTSLEKMQYLYGLYLVINESLFNF
jgi:hypothetical protein